MACKIRNLSVLAYANGFTLWSYKTQDALQDVLDIRSSYYFSDVADMLTSGDMILIAAGGKATVQMVAMGPTGTPFLVPLS